MKRRHQPLPAQRRHHHQQIDFGFFSNTVSPIGHPAPCRPPATTPPPTARRRDKTGNGGIQFGSFDQLN
jgi:hypothetical protein